MSPVHGYCPMGCGQTLAVHDGRVVCRSGRCPDPTAVDRLLADAETEHIVEVSPVDFAVQHPIRERLAGVLFTCSLHSWLKGRGGPPLRPGRYRALWNPTEPELTNWERL